METIKGLFNNVINFAATEQEDTGFIFQCSYRCLSKEECQSAQYDCQEEQQCQQDGVDFTCVCGSQKCNQLACEEQFSSVQ